MSFFLLILDVLLAVLDVEITSNILRGLLFSTP